MPCIWAERLFRIRSESFKPHTKHIELPHQFALLVLLEVPAHISGRACFLDMEQSCTEHMALADVGVYKGCGASLYPIARHVPLQASAGCAVQKVLYSAAGARSENKGKKKRDGEKRRQQRDSSKNKQTSGLIACCSQNL